MSERRRRENAVRRRASERADDLAGDYRADGWDALALRPANVVPVPVGPGAADERDPDTDVGLSFLLPVAEFDLLAELVAGAFETEVVRGGRGPHAAAVVVVRDGERRRALALPLVFHEPTAAAMAGAARDRGELDLLVRSAVTDREVRVPLDPEALLGGTGPDGA